jgi:hypothetical protein
MFSINVSLYEVFHLSYCNRFFISNNPSEEGTHKKQERDRETKREIEKAVE